MIDIFKKVMCNLNFENMIKYLIIVLLPVLILACKNHQESIENMEGKVIDLVNFDSKLTANKLELYDSVTIIPFNINSPIGKIGKILFSGDAICIWDKNADKVWGFNSKGDSLFCIDKQGKGPGEYVRIGDVSISNLGYINILDTGRKTILTYNLKGEFENLKNLGRWAHNYSSVGGYEYLFSATPENRNGIYIEVLEKSKIIKSYFPSTHIWYYDGTEFNPSGDSLFFTRRYDDHIYCFKNGVLNVAYNVNFGHDQSFMLKLQDAKTIEENHKIRRSVKYMGDIRNLSISDTHITFNYIEDQGESTFQTHFIYNKQRKKGLSFKSFGDSDKEYFFVGAPIATDGHYFYALIETWNLDDTHKHQLQKMVNFPINSNSNSLLCRFLIKL